MSLRLKHILFVVRLPSAKACRIGQPAFDVDDAVVVGWGAKSKLRGYVPQAPPDAEGDPDIARLRLLHEFVTSGLSK